MKSLKTFIAVTLTFITLTHSKPSQAAVGLFSGGSTAVVGLYMIGGGVVGGYVGTRIMTRGCDGLGCLGAIIPLGIGAIVVGLGLLVLDGEQEIEFKALDKKEATKLGLTEIERLSFNEELDQANMLLADVAAEMTKLEKPTAEDSRNAWNDVKDLVAPETFSAMVKIASQK